MDFSAACGFVDVFGLLGELMIKAPPLSSAGGEDDTRLYFQVWRRAVMLLEMPLRPCITAAFFKELLAASANAMLVEVAGRLREEDREILNALQGCGITSLQHGLPIDNQARFIAYNEAHYNSFMANGANPGGELSSVLGLLFPIVVACVWSCDSNYRPGCISSFLLDSHCA